MMKTAMTVTRLNAVDLEGRSQPERRRAAPTLPGTVANMAGGQLTMNLYGQCWEGQAGVKELVVGIDGAREGACDVTLHVRDFTGSRARRNRSSRSP